eukprot:12366797-Alexandrium_andersonii.AAC.1
MSASLVGSEMCIRDSYPCRLGRAWRLAGPVQGSSPSAAIQEALLWLITCLLYTSDAADDM